VSVFRAVGGKAEETGRGKALDEEVERRLRLGIDPMDVLDGQ
jgi:hypothetical protein